MWDVNCPDMFTPSYASPVSEAVGTITDRVEDLRKLSTRISQLVTILYRLQLSLQMFWRPKAHSFLLELGRCTKEKMGVSNAYFYLIQKISVELQRRNVVSVVGSGKMADSDY